ncbi:LysR family transcriptional regulator [Leucothrix pacifica]|uniref:LysR family transcriptional regulator n=1 Tax=Leucothrix pacifica TaxID=1247513 RepID=A0A317CIG5_9GAMM|nr:LysR family transcriptional regulator [Leucothrix pacifica]PWQ98067.1 LysR family transcriptional regulator [Leucothrix pacifica]
MNVFDHIPLLRTFVCVIESGSLSAAARRLNTTQPTISRQLKALEQAAGTTLLNRDTRRMKLTSVGHQVLSDAKSVIALVEASDARLQDEQAQIKGHIQCFSIIDFGQSVVSRMLAGFIDANPQIRIDLSYSNRPIRMIEEGYDMGIIAGDVTDDSIIARPLGRIERLIVCAPERLNGQVPQSPQDIACWPWVSLNTRQFGETSPLVLHHQNGDKQTITVSPVLTTEGVTSIREAVCMGLGVALLPTWLIKEDLLAKRLVRVLPDWQPQDISAHVVYPSSRHVPRRVQHLINYTTEYMASV